MNRYLNFRCCRVKSKIRWIVLSCLVSLILGCSETENVNERVDVEIENDSIATTIRLATWNIRIFSDNSRNDEELQLIANVLIDYDFIAIVELRDENVLKRTERILELMGKDYDYVMSSRVGGRVKERYAFLFDRQMVNVLVDGRVFPDPNDTFFREPYFATFKAGNFDFTAIVVHVIWGTSVSERRSEVQGLANVYQAVQELNEAEQDVILLGDFNRNPDDVIAYQPLMQISGMLHVVNLPSKSHIKDSSLYDNIFFQSQHVTEYTGESGIDRFDETDFGNNDRAASLALSDHRPVWGEYLIDKDDD